MAFQLRVSCSIDTEHDTDVETSIFDTFSSRYVNLARNEITRKTRGLKFHFKRCI